MNGPGSTCALRLVSWDCDLPEPGDFLRTPTGTSYRIDAVRECRPGSKSRATVRVTRLEKDAVQLGEPGVHEMVWESRDRRRA